MSLGMGVQRGVDVLVHELEHVRLLHRDHVVAVERLRRITAPELLVQGQ